MQAPRRSVWWKIHIGKAFLTQCDRLTLFVPSIYKISEPLLDSEYDQIKLETVATTAASDSVGLMCDGLTNIRNEPIISFVVSQPKPIFWKSFHTDVQSHSREYIATKILKVIEKLEGECGEMDFGVVTDNAKSYEKSMTTYRRKISNNYLLWICCALSQFDFLRYDKT